MASCGKSSPTTETKLSLLVKKDDEKEKKMVEISILKNISLNGVKLLKDMVLEVSSADAGKLVAENKARIIE